ncbi:hypothetical protein FACS1894208_03590 [Clostridia bacterium]|nr:hypothetical protein FACS1894208_03590 [Clostridia bacterium]
MDIHKLTSAGGGLLKSLALKGWFKGVGSRLARVGAGFLLAQTTVFGGLAPFGAAFVAGQAVGGQALFAMLGALIGYLLTGFDNGMRYMAVILLTVSASVAFRESAAARSKLFTPLLGTALYAVIGLIYRLARGIDAASVVMLLIELALIFGGATLFASRRYTRGEAVRDGAKTSDFAVRRLTDIARGFRQVSETLPLSGDNPDPEGADAAFDRASKDICRGCEKMERCWETELSATYAAIRGAAKLCERRGHAENIDLTGFFAERCLYLSSFVDAVNNEMAAILYRRQFRARVRENREHLKRQYAVAAAVVERAAAGISAGVTSDPRAEERVERLLGVRASVYGTPSGRMRVDLTGDKLGDTDISDLPDIVGFRVNPPETAGGVTTFWESEPIAATLGVAAHKRGGSPMSGDSGAYFKSDEAGKLYIILSDGMGSGADAARESRNAVKLLESLLRLQIAEESAMELVNSALVLGESAAFVTVDLLSLDLFSGLLTSYKYGAAPTYCKRGANLERIMCSALPAGLGAHRPDIRTLEDSQWVALITDGVTDSDGENDKWLSDYVSRLSDDDSAGDAAAKILSQAMQRGHSGSPADDMTVLVLKARRGAVTQFGG